MASAAGFADATSSASLCNEVCGYDTAATEREEVDSEVILTQVSHAASADLMVTEDGSSPRKTRLRRRTLGLQREPATPQKPKRVKSAYELFCAKERQSVLDEIRTRDKEAPLNLGELSKNLSERWSHLDATARDCYKDLAMKERLAREAIQKPKKPASSYLLFLQDPARRAQAEEELKMEGKEVTFIAMGTKLGRMWQAATPELKAELSAQHEKSMLEYKEKLAIWQAKTPADPDCSRGKRKTGRTALESQSAAGNHGFAQDPKRRNATTASPHGPRKQRLVRRRSLTTLDLDAATLAEAQRLELEVPLLELANSLQLLEAGVKAKTEAGAVEILSALVKAKGLVDEAERSILLRAQQRSAEEADERSSNHAQEGFCV